jgi:hypothetical protein
LPESSLSVALFSALHFLLLYFNWHIWTLFQEGHQEIGSHDFSDKITLLFSIEYYLALQKYFFRYLGILPGAALVVYVLRCALKKEDGSAF